MAFQANLSTAYDEPTCQPMRKPTRTRKNVKHRRIKPPPLGTNLAEVAAASRYVGSVYHKDTPSFAGMPRPRPDATICPRHLANCRDLVEEWLREAIQAGRSGAWERGFPRYVWHCADGVVFEARQGSPGSGSYHGYPLTPEQQVAGLG